MVKHKTVTVREGEYQGPVDWDYDFSQHFENYGEPDERKNERCEKKKEMLRTLEENPSKYEASFYAHCYRNVHKVGMYDGWPFWRPVPAIQIYDPVANKLTWKQFDDIKYIREKEGN